MSSTPCSIRPAVLDGKLLVIYTDGKASPEAYVTQAPIATRGEGSAGIIQL